MQNMDAYFQLKEKKEALFHAAREKRIRAESQKNRDWILLFIYRSVG